MSTAIVTVVVVAYRSRDRIGRCLDSIAHQDLPPGCVRTVVVDNASGDGTSELLTTHYPWVDLIRAPGNLGFAGGNNLALDSVETPFVVLLNDDAVAEPGLFSALLDEFAQADASVAAVTARVLLAERFRRVPTHEPGAIHGPDGSWLPDPAGPAELVNSTGNEVRTDGFGQDRGWLAEASLHHPPATVFGFCGAAAALRTSALRVVGTFDSTFFMYYEDTDLSWRLRLAGFQVRYCSTAVVHHEHATSSGEGSPSFVFHDARNRLLAVTKNAPPGLAARVVGRFLVTTVSMAVRRTAAPDQIRLRLRVIASYTRMLRTALRARHRIGRTAVVSRSAVAALLVEPPQVATGGYRRP